MVRFSATIANLMRHFTATFLALLLVLTNMVLAADVHAEAFSGQHHPGVALHADDHDHGDPGDNNHPPCHHCCHAQAHFFSLAQHANADWSTAPGHDWTITDTSALRLLGHAPPVPPPKA